MKSAVKKTKNGWYQAIAYLGRGEQKYFTRKKKPEYLRSVGNAKQDAEKEGAPE